MSALSCGVLSCGTVLSVVVVILAVEAGVVGGTQENAGMIILPCGPECHLPPTRTWVHSWAQVTARSGPARGGGTAPAPITKHSAGGLGLPASHRPPTVGCPFLSLTTWPRGHGEEEHGPAESGEPDASWFLCQVALVDAVCRDTWATILCDNPCL